MPHPPLLARIGQVALTVADLEQAIPYYRDALGMRFLFRTPAMAFFQCGDARVLVGTENPHAQRVFLYFFVDDIRDAHARLVKEGVAFEGAPKTIAKLPDREVWLVEFRDPAGTMHHLMSEVPVQAGTSALTAPSSEKA